MKIFVKYITDYFKVDFNWAVHLAVGLFLAAAIATNYSLNFYEYITVTYNHSFYSVVYLFLIYVVGFLGVSLILSLFLPSDKKIILNKKYLIFGGIGIFFLALDGSYYLMDFTTSLYNTNPFVAAWQRACVSNLSSLITVIIPLYFIYFGVRYFKPEWYGLRLNNAKVLPYFWLILGMIPLIYLASFQPDFLETYPTYTDNYEYRFLETEQWKTVGLYELTYGFDFLSVELFFRGFMVIALSRFVGKEAILPMVVVYCFLHFGKPMGEAISSIFGGYILGIFAYSSRNIYGGLIAHLGVAWGMEYLAYLNL
jgi:hypothetical protein